MYNFTTRAFTPVSDYVGKNSYPMWIGNKMYFVSDRTNGIANLYAQDLSTKQITPITSYTDFDVMMPSTDGTHIVFVYGGDLWSVPREGGAAQRLTAGPGIETSPAFSPDGSRIAFTGEYDGNVDVFVIPAAGASRGGSRGIPRPTR
jgi:tricorn protease-like protein